MADDRSHPGIPRDRNGAYAFSFRRCLPANVRAGFQMFYYSARPFHSWELPYLLHRLVLVESLSAMRSLGAPTKWKAGQWTRLFLWSCQGTWVEKSSHIDIRRWRAKNETLGEKTNDFLLSLVYSVNTFWAWITCAAAFQQMYNCIVLRKFIEIGLLSKHLFMRNRC